MLKLAAIIETHGGNTEKVPVNLMLSPHIESFETLREQHGKVAPASVAALTHRLSHPPFLSPRPPCGCR